ncbi:VaFE repeat-containing surface-anchored protein, partial [Floricoccus penangensis]
NANGTVDVNFTFDANALEGKTIVVFEKLFQNGKEVASHEDINDKGQTVEVPKKPEVPVIKIGTTAVDAKDGDKKVSAEKNVTIKDAVKYENLVVGKEYTVTGKLMDKSTNKPLLVDGKEVTGSTTFTAEKANGSVDVTFTFDASALEGKTIVVFEKLFQNGKEVA